MILKLSDILDNQNPGVRQNAYKYKIVPILECYDKNDRSICQVYSNIEDIPEIYLNGQVYNIEPDIDPNGCMYLKIIIL